MTPPDCPPAADLQRMLADDLPPDRAAAVEGHVATCPACQAELERLTDTPTALGRDLPPTRTGRAGADDARPRSPGPLPEVPGYEIERELGRGGMGVVYRARQVKLGRTVALKMILAGEFAAPEVTERFLAEAGIVARMAHPNVVQVFDFGDVRGRAYFAMEYVGGGTLADRLTGASWSPPDAAALIEAVARGLHQAHAAGVVHRDLKPANILIAADGTPKVADFGVAKLTEGGHGLTGSQALIGSPNYMSPEQADGRSAAVGPAADVHALGAILYELLTGRKAFDAPTPLTVLEQVRTVPPTPPSRVARGVPRDLETVCLVCLEKDPARRYASAALVADDLTRFRAGQPVLARPIGRTRRLARWAGRHPVESGLVAALFLALALGLLGTAWKWREAVRERNTATSARGRAEQGEAAATAALGEAEVARRSADRARDDWQRLSSEAAFARGDVLARHGDVTAGLFWMVEALRIAPADDPHWAELLRRNVGGWAARLHARAHTVTWHSPVNTAAFSPDGSLLLAGTAGGETALVDPGTGTVIDTLPRIAGGVECVAFAPDGTRAYACALDGVHQLTVRDRELIDDGPRFPKAGDGPASLTKAFRCALSPDGKRLAVVGLRRKATLWDVDSGRSVRTFDTGSDDWVFFSVTYSPDGQLLAFGVRDERGLRAPAEAQVWAVEGGADRPAVRLPHPAAVLSVRFHPTDDRLVLTSCADGNARLWDRVKGQLRHDPLDHPHRTVEQAAFSPDGRVVVTSCADGWVRWWETETGRPLGPALRHDGGMYGATFDAAGRRLATYSADHTLRLWDVAPAALPVAAPLRTAMRAVIAADGSRAAAAGGTFVHILDTATGEAIGPRREVPQGLTTPLAFGPGGRTFAAVDTSGVLRVWEGPERVVEADLKRDCHALAFDPTGKWLAVVGAAATIEVWDVPARKRAHTLRQSGITWMAAFDPTGRWLAVASDGEPTARLWDLSGPEPAGSDLPTGDKVGAIHFRPDGRAVLAEHHGRAQLWDLAARAPVGPEIGPFVGEFQTAFGPDGRLLASWSARQVRLWDGATGEPRPGRTFDHPAEVRGVAFDPTGGTLVVALADRTAQFWDPATGRPLGPPVAVGARPLAVGWVRAAGRFVAVGDDGKVHRLAVPDPAAVAPDELAARLRERTGFQLAAGTVSPVAPVDR